MAGVNIMSSYICIAAESNRENYFKFSQVILKLKEYIS